MQNKGTTNMRKTAAKIGRGNTPVVRSSTQISDNNALKQRVLNIADLLPTDYIDLVAQMDSSLATPTGRQRIANVKTLRTADEHITSLLERVHEAFQKMKAAL